MIGLVCKMYSCKFWCGLGNEFDGEVSLWFQLRFASLSQGHLIPYYFQFIKEEAVHFLALFI